jgi:hypothetical protein
VRQPVFNQYEKKLRSRVPCCLIALAVQFVPVGVRAEFICSSGVQYTWKRAGEENSHQVFWGAVQANASSEVEAKRGLEVRVRREESRALEECRRLHESLGACVAGKLGAHHGTLNRLSFTARKSLEDALVKECKDAEGTCGPISRSEVKCEEKVVATPAEAPAGNAKGGKGDEKKKKK